MATVFEWFHEGGASLERYAPTAISIFDVRGTSRVRSLISVVVFTTPCTGKVAKRRRTRGGFGFADRYVSALRTAAAKRPSGGVRLVTSTIFVPRIMSEYISS